MEIIVIHTVVCFVVMAANVVLLVLATKVPNLGSQKDTFVILQLAFWDTVHSGVVISSNLLRIATIIANQTTDIDSHECLYYPCYDLFILTFQMVPYASVIVSIERFMATWCPMRYQRMNVRKPLRLGVVVAALALAVTLIAVIINYYSPTKKVSPLCYVANFMDPWVWSTMITVRIGLTILSVIIYIPVFVKIIILKRTCTHQTIYSKRLMRTSIVFSLLFWGSIFLVIIPDAVLTLTEFGVRNQPLIYLLNAVKCILNVVVISLLHKDVKYAFLKLFKCRTKECVRVHHVRSSGR